MEPKANLEFLDEVPITSGYRYSALGYTDIPEVAAFSQDKLFDIFSNKKEGSFSNRQNKLEDLKFDEW